MVPALFMCIDSLPVNINGKLDKRALPEPIFNSVDTYVAPSNSLEEKMCDIWQATLGLDRVGINDNFFSLGGNSIMAIKLIAASGNELNVDIPLALLFEHKTIAGIAANLHQEESIVIPKAINNQQSDVSTIEV
jgi:acyl carrier protein